MRVPHELDPTLNYSRVLFDLGYGRAIRLASGFEAWLCPNCHMRPWLIFNFYLFILMIVDEILHFYARSQRMIIFFD